jgi:hypothetical protein
MKRLLLSFAFCALGACQSGALDGAGPVHCAALRSCYERCVGTPNCLQSCNGTPTAVMLLGAIYLCVDSACLESSGVPPCVSKADQSATCLDCRMNAVESGMGCSPANDPYCGQCVGQVIDCDRDGQ